MCNANQEKPKPRHIDCSLCVTSGLKTDDYVLEIENNLVKPEKNDNHKISNHGSSESSRIFGGKNDKENIDEACSLYITQENSEYKISEKCKFYSIACLEGIFILIIVIETIISKMYELFPFED